MSDNDSRTTRKGGCQCGAVRYELSADPLAPYVCHCHECRRQSASAFGISMMAPRAALRLTAGTPRFWSRPTDSGNILRCAFCPTCGTRLWDEGDWPDISVKGGSLDEPPDLRAAVHVWTSRMLPGIVLPAGAVQFPGEPP